MLEQIIRPVYQVSSMQHFCPNPGQGSLNSISVVSSELLPTACTLISLITLEVGINVEGVEKLQNQ